MSKVKMVLYGAMGSLVSVLIWSFIGGCHTSSGPAPAPRQPEPSAQEVMPPPPELSEEVLVEEGIVAGPPPAAAEPVEEEEELSPAAEPSAPRIHVVEGGDTLWGLSRRYGVTVRELEEANQLADPGRLAIGQKLIIP